MDCGGINKLLRQVLEVHHKGRPDLFKGGVKKYTDNELLGIIADALEFLLTGDNAPDGRLLKAQVIEDICAQTVLELREQGLTGSSEDYYLERHAFDVQSRIENAAIRVLHVMEG